MLRRLALFGGGFVIGHSALPGGAWLGSRVARAATTADATALPASAARPLPPYVAPPMIVRANSRYFSNAGNDLDDGETPQTAWRDVWTQVRRGAVPDDTNLYFVGEDFHCKAPRGLVSVAQADNKGTLLPSRITFAPASQVWRETTIHGPDRSLNAFSIVDPVTRAGDGLLDWQIWGLRLTDWHGTGVITIGGRARKVYLDGLFLGGNGQPDHNQYHDIYLSGSKTDPKAVPDDIRIRGCTSVGDVNAGFFLHVYNGDAGMNPTNVLVEGNVVTRIGNGGILLANAFHPASNWTIRQNDIRVDGSRAMMIGGARQASFPLYFYAGSGPRSPADASVRMTDNLFALLDARPDAEVSMPSAAVANPSGAAPATSGNQFYVPAGRMPARRFIGGPGDVSIDGLPTPMKIMAPSRKKR
ncbi:MAG: hypothetical protein QM674_09300 [Burkholderiaceae bacterium]